MRLLNALILKILRYTLRTPSQHFVLRVKRVLFLVGLVACNVGVSHPGRISLAGGERARRSVHVVHVLIDY